MMPGPPRKFHLTSTQLLDLSATKMKIKIDARRRKLARQPFVLLVKKLAMTSQLFVYQYFDYKLFVINTLETKSP